MAMFNWLTEAREQFQRLVSDFAAITPPEPMSDYCEEASDEQLAALMAPARAVSRR